jgi:methionyl-tRNA formyltransferase
LLAHGVDVALVVTHEDNPNETLFFASLKNLAEHYDIPVLSPASASAPTINASSSGVSASFAS